MRDRRLNNKIAESRFTLPVCVILAVAVWWYRWFVLGMDLHLSVAGLLITFLTGYVVLETRGTFQLIRVRTQLDTAFWLLLAVSLPVCGAQLSLTRDVGALACAGCLAISLSLVQHCQQARLEGLHNREAGYVFYATLLCAAIGIWQHVMLVMVVPCFAVLLLFIRALTLRTFCAGVLGMALPLAMWGAWLFLTDDYASFAASLGSLAAYMMQLPTWAKPSLSALLDMPLRWQVMWGVLLFYSLVGLLHYWRSNYNDKIQMRMMMYVYCLYTLFLHLVLVVRPNCVPQLAAMLAVSMSPLLAHYFAVTRSRWCAFVFFLSLLLYVVLLTIDLWMPLFNL